MLGLTVSTRLSQYSPVNLYFEDVNIGQEIWTESHIVTENDILTFAEVTRDRHPLHTDPEYCGSHFQYKLPADRILPT